MKYYITKDNDDGGRETVAVINGSAEDAFKAFSETVKAQSIEYHINKTIDRWHVLRLFDENNDQLAQET